MKNPDYVYIFVRQDLSREQQLVQAAHVALVLGNKLNCPKVDDIYFQVCGVPQLIDFRGVMDTLNTRSLKFETFYEPDQGNTLTAIATHPIPKDERGNLRDFPLLRLA